MKNSNLKPDDFASLANHPTLTSLNLFDVVMPEKDLAFLPTLSKLNSAVLVMETNSETWHHPLANLKNAELRLDLHSDAFSAQDSAHLTEFTNLKNLNLDFADHNSDIVDELCKITSLEQLTITSPNFDEEAMLKLAVLPNLRRLVFPPHLNTPAIREKFLAKRTELKLEHVHLAPQPRTPKPAPKQGKKAANSPNATTK